MQKLSFRAQGIEKTLNAADLSRDTSLVDQVYWVLRKNIINLNLPPEMPLVEKDIATIFGISKTPVREALIRLANDRLVNVVPKSGSYVTPISLERYFEACFIRIHLEGGCVKRLAEHGIGLPEQVKLRSIITKQKQVIDQQQAVAAAGKDVDYTPFFAADEQFHRSLFECAGIPGAWELLNRSKAELDRVRHLKKMVGINRSNAVIEEHTQIVDTIISRDPEAAVQTMEYHIGGIDDEVSVISENPQFLHSMEELNMLIKIQHRGRSKRSRKQATAQ